MKRIITIIIMMMLLVIPAQASIIDDINQGIDDAIKKINPLTVPVVGSVYVTCADGSTNCKYYGDNWHITTTVIASNQNLVFTLPAGTSWKDSAGTTTTGTTVKFTLSPRNAYQKQPVAPMTTTYRTCLLGLVCGYDKPIPGFNPAGYSYKVVEVKGKIESASGTNEELFVFSYDKQPVYSMSDGKYTMQFTPSYIIDWGIDIGTSSLVFVDDGYGNYIPFLSSQFFDAQRKTESDINYNLGGLPGNWKEYLAYMKSKYGLTQYNLPGENKISVSGTVATLEYPYGAVGIVGEMLIPKAMATSVTVQIDDGKPEIGSVSVSPNPFTLGSGYITVTVPVKNVGTSTDNFRMTIDQSFGTVSYDKNGGSIANGMSDTYTAKISPTVTTSQTPSFTITVEATGSHEKSTVTKTVSLVASDPTKPKQWVAITTYAPDGKQLSNAPIFQNGLQIGTGFKRVELEYGTYEFSTDNKANPTLFAPIPYPITLTGGSEVEVSLKFTTSPPGADLTWLFWVFVGMITFIGFYYTKNPIFIFIGLLIGMLYVGMMLMESANALADKLNPFNWFR